MLKYTMRPTVSGRTGGCIMKRVLVALLAISMAAGVLTGCGSKGSEKTFTVGFDAEFPPYGYRDDNGEYVG